MLFLALAACSSQSDEAVLKDTISEMVALLDAGEDQKLISEYAYFEGDVATRIPTKLPDSARKTLKAVLLSTQQLSPKFSENNTLAVFHTDKRVWFIKQQGKWRLMDKEPRRTN